MKKSVRILALIMALAMAVLTLSACSKAEEKNEIVFGTNAEFPPFEFVSAKGVIGEFDGIDIAIADKIAKDYPEVKHDVWFVDITTAKLIDPARRSAFKVFVLPNLYGDIITDEAAQIQGGVGTAGSANIGTKYAMFEAIHGSAPRMVTEGRAQYADPCSMIKAVAMMMDHIGEAEKAKKLNMALDVCCQFEKKLVMTGRDTGATGDEFAEYIMETIQRPDLEQVWQGYIDAAIAANKN